MATRSTIARQLSENEYRAISCHWDGYPEGVGAYLVEYYNTPEKVDALLDLGDLSSLHSKLEPTEGSGHSFDTPEDDVTVAYGRDRGEENVEAETFNSIKELKRYYSDSEFVYIFTLDNVWKFTYNIDSTNTLYRLDKYLTNRQEIKEGLKDIGFNALDDDAPELDDKEVQELINRIASGELSVYDVAAAFEYLPNWQKDIIVNRLFDATKQAMGQTKRWDKKHNLLTTSPKELARQVVAGEIEENKKGNKGKVLKECEEIAHKSVYDSDGFTTDYTLYYDSENDKYFTIFGDTDLYKGIPSEADMTFDTKKEADEWFANYRGFEDFNENKLKEEKGTTKDYSKETTQGYEIKGFYSMGKWNGKDYLYAIFKQSDQLGYVIAEGYDLTDGTWDNGLYGFKTKEDAINRLKKMAKDKETTLSSVKISGSESNKKYSRSNFLEGEKRYPYAISDKNLQKIFDQGVAKGELWQCACCKDWYTKEDEQYDASSVYGEGTKCCGDCYWKMQVAGLTEKKLKQAKPLPLTEKLIFEDEEGPEQVADTTIDTVAEEITTSNNVQGIFEQTASLYSYLGDSLSFSKFDEETTSILTDIKAELAEIVGKLSKCAEHSLGIGEEDKSQVKQGAETAEKVYGGEESEETTPTSETISESYEQGTPREIVTTIKKNQGAGPFGISDADTTTLLEFDQGHPVFECLIEVQAKLKWEDAGGNEHTADRPIYITQLEINKWVFDYLETASNDIEEAIKSASIEELSEGIYSAIESISVSLPYTCSEDWDGKLQDFDSDYLFNHDDGCDVWNIECNVDDDTVKMIRTGSDPLGLWDEELDEAKKRKKKRRKVGSVITPIPVPFHTSPKHCEGGKCGKGTEGESGETTSSESSTSVDGGVAENFDAPTHI